MKLIKLTQNRNALVNDLDFEYLNQFKWTYSHGYAVRAVKKIRIYMHRVIMEANKSQIVDHINRDKLDNTRANLRFVTKSQNLHNSGPQINNTSGERNVYWHKQAKKWMVRIEDLYNDIYLGLFPTMNEAIKVREDYLRKARFLIH